MKTRTRPKTTKTKQSKIKSKAKKARSRSAELAPVKSQGRQEKLYKLLQRVANLSANFDAIEGGTAVETPEMRPQKAWTRISGDIAQIMELVQGQPSDIDCSVLHAINSIVFSIGVRIRVAEADGDSEGVDWAIRQGFSGIHSVRSRLDALAEKLKPIVRTGSKKPAKSLEHKLPRRPHGALNREVAELWKAGERDAAKIAQTLNCQDAGIYAPTSRKSVEATETWKKKHKAKALRS